MIEKILEFINKDILISYQSLGISMIVLCGTILILFILLYKTKQNLNKSNYFLDIIRSISKSISKNHELAAFNENGDIIYTTHPQLYSDKNSFFQNLIGKVTASQDFQKFHKLFEKGQNHTTLLSGSGSGLNNQFKKWFITETFLNKSDSLINEDISLVTLTDVSKQFSESEKVAINYEKLEKFLDHFPLGIFYINNKGIIIGSNTTFANQLNSSREKLIGVNISEFIKDFNDNISNQTPNKVLITPKFSKNFKALLIKSSIPNTMQPWILMKTIDIETEKQNDLTTENIFSFSVIPSIIVNINGMIKAINPALSNMIQDKVIIDKNKILTQNFNLSEFITNSKELINHLQKKSSSIEVKLSDENTTAIAYITSIDENLFLIQLVDISSQKILEQQFIQSQKIQAVGQLAGGIAHDFNNLLTAMIGFCDLLLQRYTVNDPSYSDVMQIKQNAGRAANLVRQLLAFSRQQTLMPKVVSITEALTDLSSLLKRLIGVDIDFQINHGRDLWPVKVDINQFEQVIINLVINARDAMAGKGSLTIKTKNYFSDKDFKCIYDIAPSGDYVLIEVIDTGCGIKPEFIEKIFEPFFSDKDEKIKKASGSGTGLGLATVYGIVNQTGGFIGVDTEVNKGTTFKIYLPRYKGKETIQKVNLDQISKDLTGSETILLVEDEEPVRLFSSRALRNKGYKVLEAACGEEALQIAKKEKFDLLITDVVMPKIDGPTLNKKLRETINDFKTIFISGYAKDTFREDIGKNSRIHFLQKPFSLKDLATKVKEVLHAQ
ncbi:MAG: ATP-binding protein [Alphaproteobacteria bacterium]|nr:ATP-binding protein [Alphaproteobacteria bacterium]